jgi:hypothetical protein
MTIALKGRHLAGKMRIRPEECRFSDDQSI